MDTVRDDNIVKWNDNWAVSETKWVYHQFRFIQFLVIWSATDWKISYEIEITSTIETIHPIT